MQYTLPQLEAIQTIDQNLQIIACAGSGKTQVISARIVEILARGVKPAEIIAFTFTEKAAGELKDRIYRLSVERLGTDHGLGDMFVGTIHGYCLNLLQSPPLYRYLKYDVLDDVQQRLFIDRNSSKSGLTQTPLLKDGKRLERWKDSGLYQQIISLYHEGSLNLQSVPVEVQMAVASYRQLMHEHHHLDYSMIVSEAVEELTKNEILRQQIASQIRYLVVDEYQDVNPLQERLVRLIHDLGANLCVVGDDDQTIYQWRGSEVENIIHFSQNYPSVKSVTLAENFRSSTAIVGAARTVIERNPTRLPKRMESSGMQPFELGNVLALSFANPEDEAEWIAKQIKALYGTPYQDNPSAPNRGLAYSDFAILLRSVKKDAPIIATALDQLGIPYVTGGVNHLFDTPEAQAIRSAFYYMVDFASQGMPSLTRQEVYDHFVQAHFGLVSEQIEAGLSLLDERKRMLGNIVTNQEIYLQQLYLDLLQTMQVREERIPTVGGRTGEIVFYNLGKFSQVISDYEKIHFRSNPQDLYHGFANFLNRQAPDYYPEGWEDVGYAQLDAVQILTVHKSKGMQWPVVFVPCLRRNRFPSRRHGGRQVWHIIPEEAVPNVERYKGTVEDERRLFYVALTRAERYLYASFSPLDTNQYNKKSDFHLELTSSSEVLTVQPPTYVTLPKVESVPKHEQKTLNLTFSELRYFFDCPYSFKLRFLYGFNEPVALAVGYGKSLHDALAEIHSEAIKGHIMSVTDVPRLVDTHLSVPFADPLTRDNLTRAAIKSLTSYLQQYGAQLSKLEHAEKTIELKLGDGIVVNGRIDLIRRTDTDEYIIVDFKSNKRAQAEDLTLKQLQVYALGYEQLTGRRANLIEIHNMDDGGVDRAMVDETLIHQTVSQIGEAGNSLRENRLTRLPKWCNTCASCAFAGICRSPERK